MKKAITFFLIACCLLPLTGCSKDQVLGRYNEVLQAAGEATLTGSGDLEGERSFGADHYVGSYAADYEGFSGEERFIDLNVFYGTKEAFEEFLGR